MNTPAQCGVIKPPKTDIYSEAPQPRPTSPRESAKAKPHEKPDAASSATSPASSTDSSNTPPQALDTHRSIGKVERFHRTLLEEWASIRPWTSEQQRQDAYRGFLHYYNHHRTHSALNWQTPASTIGNNLPGMHT